MNSESRKVANSISRKFWNDERGNLDLLRELTKQSFVHNNKQIVFFIIDFVEDKDFILEMAPKSYKYSSSQDIVSFLSEYDGNYYILASESTLFNMSNLNFGVACELGHIFLNHISDKKKWLGNDTNFDKLKIQADEFAKELLVPMDKMSEIMNSYNGMTMNEAAKMFGVPLNIVKAQIDRNIKNKGL